MAIRTLRGEIESLRDFLNDETQPYPELAREARAFLDQALTHALRAPDPRPAEGQEGIPETSTDESEDVRVARSWF